MNGSLQLQPIATPMQTHKIPRGFRQFDLIQRLFAISTMLASEIVEESIAGQSPRLNVRQRRVLALKIEHTASELVTISQSVHIALQLKDHHASK